MADPLVATPASFVPRYAVSFGGEGSAAIAVSIANPLPVVFGAGPQEMRSAAPANAAAATIAVGASLSGAVDLAADRLHRIVVPAGWTTAAISFQGSADGASWADLWFGDAEVTLPAATAVGGRAVVTNPAVFLGVRHLRLRSGTAAAPVAQTAERALTLVTVAR